MAFIKLIEYEKPKLKDPILVQGLPGLGLVGKLAVDYIVEELKLPKIAELYSSHLLLPQGNAGIFIEIDGTFNLPRYEFYLYKGEENDIIFLAGNTQPVAWGQYEVAEKVLEYFEKMGGKMVIAVCGTTAAGEESRVFCTADDPETIEYLKKLGFKVSSSGSVTGACGVLPGLAKIRGFKTFILMGSVQRTYVDPEAAREVVKALVEILKIKISLEDLDKMIRDFRRKEEEMVKLREIWERVEERRRREPEQPWYV